MFRDVRNVYLFSHEGLDGPVKCTSARKTLDLSSEHLTVQWWARGRVSSDEKRLQLKPVNPVVETTRDYVLDMNDSVTIDNVKKYLDHVYLFQVEATHYALGSPFVMIISANNRWRSGLMEEDHNWPLTVGQFQFDVSEFAANVAVKAFSTFSDRRDNMLLRWVITGTIKAVVSKILKGTLAIRYAFGSFQVSDEAVETMCLSLDFSFPELYSSPHPRIRVPADEGNITTSDGAAAD